MISGVRALRTLASVVFFALAGVCLALAGDAKNSEPVLTILFCSDSVGNYDPCPS